MKGKNPLDCMVGVVATGFLFLGGIHLMDGPWSNKVEAVGFLATALCLVILVIEVLRYLLAPFLRRLPTKKTKGNDQSTEDQKPD